MKKNYIAPETQVRVVMAQTMICTSPGLYGNGTGAPQLSKDEIDLTDAMDLEGAMDILDDWDF